MKKLRLGLIGCGTIGSGLLKQVKKNLAAKVVISHICDVDPVRARDVKARLHLSARVSSCAETIAGSDIVVEAASQAVAAQVVPAALKRHKAVLVMSVGGILRINGLQTMLAKSNGSLLIPSGAIAGLDAIAAARSATITRATLTTAKPLKGLAGAPYFDVKGIVLAKIKKPTVIFEGSAVQAIRYFPKNVNVAAVLSLATLGPRRVRVRLITSPTFTRNTHTVEVEGSFGKITTVTENVPSPENPKTSYLAVLAAYATVEKFVSSFKIGT